jgi:acyl-CoA synthetase (AMP-forming)/AMP-acid ligase II
MNLFQTSYQNFIPKLHTKTSYQNFMPKLHAKTSYQKFMPTVNEHILAAQTVRGIPPTEYPLPFISLYALLEERAIKQASEAFLIYYDEQNNRTEFSYGVFITQVREMAGYMGSLGIHAGDRIATAAHNHPDTIIQYFAAWMLGACIVPLNMSEDDERLRYILSNSGAAMLFARTEYQKRVSELAPHGTRLVTEQHWQHISDSLQPSKQATSKQATSKQATSKQATSKQALGNHIPNHLANDALIVYTSGTTGNPKGVVLTQGNILADSDSIMRFHGVNEQTRLMCVLPVHHVNGTIVTHTVPMLAGASVVLNRKFQTEYFFERIHREKVHIVSVVPTLLAFLLEAKTTTFRDENDVKKIPFRYFICGAGPLTCELARNFEQHFSMRILHGYGLSETTCYSCYLPTELTPKAHHHWMLDYGFPSIGVPLDVNEMAIHNEHGIALGEMERGEIVIRGANVMREYYQNEQANATTFAFGWFRSGDEGFFKYDERGRPFFFITGRLKELIIRGGVNLAPLEIDEVLASAPGVKAAICVGFENDFYGEEVGALVIPADNNDECNKQAILEYCQAKLPFSKAPKVVVFTNELPVTTTGKYQRNKVKHLFTAWKAVQFRKQAE